MFKNKLNNSKENEKKIYLSFEGCALPKEGEKAVLKKRLKEPVFLKEKSELNQSANQPQETEEIQPVTVSEKQPEAKEEIKPEEKGASAGIVADNSAVYNDTDLIKTEDGKTHLVKKKKYFSLTKKKALSGWLFVLPFVIGILLIYAPIVVQSVRITFSDVSFKGGGLNLTNVGFENYRYIFMKDEWFSTTIVDGLLDLVLQIPAIVIFSLFMAILLNQKMTGRAVFRAIFFIPVILSTGIIDSIDQSSKLLNALKENQGGIDDNTGAEAGGIISALDIEMLLGNIKVGTSLVEYVTKLINNIFDIVSRSGVQMLIFLSGLQSISPSIYESCEIEGASAWEIFWKITLPMISPMILVNSIYTIIDAFTSADNRVMAYIIKNYDKAEYARAGAMSWVYVGIVLIFILIATLLLKAFVFYQKRD